MRTIGTAICLLMLVGMTLLQDTAGAQIYENEFGIYTDPTGDPAAANVEVPVITPVNIYLVATNPVNHSFQGGTDTTRPIAFVNGFEAKIIFPPQGPNFWILSTSFPVQAINIGTAPDYIVSFGSPVPVVDQRVVLVTWEFFVLDTATYNTYLGVTDFPAVEGAMGILDSEDEFYPDGVQAMHPSTNDYDVPIFSVNGDAAIAVEEQSWGGVKALFR